MSKEIMAGGSQQAGRPQHSEAEAFIGVNSVLMLHIFKGISGRNHNINEGAFEEIMVENVSKLQIKWNQRQKIPIICVQ